MKKLYIPTSSLNFNNIFASESISPVTFYTKRNFGYKTFETTELNNFNNSILLFDKLPIFVIGDKERDNYPMIIEIEIEDIQPIKTHDKVSIFQWHETLYLNPFSSKVYFLSEEAKKIALLGAERSSSTKMVGLYEKVGAFNIKDDSIPSFVFNTDYLNDIKDISDAEIRKHIEIEQKKNRAKGFLYSYLLGENKSLNKDLITIKKCAKEISNIISAVLHSPDKSITSIQRKSLSDLGNRFVCAYREIDDDTKILEEKIKETIAKVNTTINVSDAQNLFKIFDISWEDIENIVIKKYNIRKPFNISSLFGNNYEFASNEINKTVLEKERAYLSDKQKTNISKKIDLANLKLTHLAEEKPDYYMALINEFLSLDYQNESKLDIAVRGINILRKMFEDSNHDWEESTQRTFYNTLLANMQGQGSFNVSDDNNIVRQSFALFVLYKDDIEKIETALISNLIPEYRFAFGLWGAVLGFASMPKTFTNDLFLSRDLTYIEKIYKYIFKQVHGIELEGMLGKKVEKNSSKVNKPISEQPQKGEQKETQQADTEELQIRQKLKEKIKDSYIESIIEEYRKNHFLINNNLFVSIKTIKGIGEKTITKIRTCLESKEPIIVQPQSQQKVEALTLEFDLLPEDKLQPGDDLLPEDDLPPEDKLQPGDEFYKDTNVLLFLKHIIPEAKLESVKQEIDWIQKVHREEGYKKSGKWIELKGHTNKEVIQHFYNNTNKNQTIESNLLISIVNKLKSLYLHHE